MSSRKYHEDRTLPRFGGIFSSRPCWVFGSNLAGRHGAGAAEVAVKKFDAQYGVGVGPTGSSYAIPTKDGALRKLSHPEIRAHVLNFIWWAKLHPEQEFFVTRIGCGLALNLDCDIAPLFVNAPLNCNMPIQWRPFLELANNGLSQRQIALNNF